MGDERHSAAVALLAIHKFKTLTDWVESQKTSIAGVQIPNWGIVLGAVVVILLIYSSMH